MIVVTGSRAAVETARLLIDTQLSFEVQLRAEKERQDALVSKLAAVDVSYGDKVCEHVFCVWMWLNIFT